MQIPHCSAISVCIFKSLDSILVTVELRRFTVPGSTKLSPPGTGGALRESSSNPPAHEWPTVQSIRSQKKQTQLDQRGSQSMEHGLIILVYIDVYVFVVISYIFPQVYVYRCLKTCLQAIQAAILTVISRSLVEIVWALIPWGSSRGASFWSQSP